MAARRGHGEGSVFQRKDGRYVGQADMGWSGGKRQRRYVTGVTKKEVQDRLRALLRDKDTDTLPKGGQLQTGPFLRAWLQDYAAPRLRPLTLRRYQGLIAHWSDIEKIPLEKLTVDHVQRILNAKSASGMAAQTVSHLRAVLRTALNSALQRQLVVRNAAALAQPPRVSKFEVTVLGEEEATRLLGGIHGDRLEPLIKIALSLGLRSGEALGLQWADVDLEAGVLRVNHALQRIKKKPELVEPKSKTSRRAILLPSFALAALRAHRGAQIEERMSRGERWMGEKWDLVFADSYGLPLEATAVTKRFQALVKSAGLPHMRFHDLRHSCATLLLVQGVPARAVMELLGHSNISLTLNTYSHIVPALQRQTADAMDRALGI